MFVAMNRFRIRKDRTAEFEVMWKERDSHLPGLPGFVAFHLLRGGEAEDHVLYASHTIWNSREDFEAWTRSEAFQKAHSRAGGSRDLYLGPPQLELFESVQGIKADGSTD
jgi:heme-degrading monooxygenase HmoA